MSKADGSARANLRATRAQINNASASAQSRAFRARQIAKDKRDVEERKLRAQRAAEKAARGAKAANAAATPTEVAPLAQDVGEPSQATTYKPATVR